MRIARACTLVVLPLLFALAVGAIALAGCTPTLPTAPPGITGTITNLTPGDERPASFLVEGPAQPPGATSDKAQVTITPNTLFFDSAGKPTKASTIAVGTNVRVWFNGAIAESYPVQGTAEAVQIVGK